MSGHTPLETVEQLIEAMNGGNTERAVSSYQEGGALVQGPGDVVIGTEALREAFETMAAGGFKVTTKNYEIIEVGDIALYCAEWSANGTAPDGSPIEIGGKSADVLRRQPDGKWLIVLDNPIGTAILD